MLYALARSNCCHLLKRVADGDDVLINKLYLYFMVLAVHSINSCQLAANCCAVRSSQKG